MAFFLVAVPLAVSVLRTLLFGVGFVLRLASAAEAEVLRVDFLQRVFAFVECRLLSAAIAGSRFAVFFVRTFAKAAHIGDAGRTEACIVLADHASAWLAVAVLEFEALIAHVRVYFLGLLGRMEIQKAVQAVYPLQVLGPKALGAHARSSVCQLTHLFAV